MAQEARPRSLQEVGQDALDQDLAEPPGLLLGWPKKGQLSPAFKVLRIDLKNCWDEIRREASKIKSLPVLLVERIGLIQDLLGDRRMEVAHTELTPVGIGSFGWLNAISAR